MSNITENPKTHVVLTFSKGEYYIDARQHDIVLKMGLNDKIIIDGNLIFGKSISEVLTIDEKFRRDHEIKKTDEDKYYPSFTGINAVLESFSPTRRKRALEKMRGGFLGHFNGSQLPRNAKAMLSNMDQKIALIK